MARTLRVVILKPSKYGPDGYVERFRWGFMPNSTLPHLRSMTPAEVDGRPVEVHTIDEYVYTDLQYLHLIGPAKNVDTLFALVGVQSHQFHRALDLAARATSNGCMSIIGGPHVMTCDTSIMHNSGISFALAEAELIWSKILEDAANGGLQSVYGTDRRWQQELDAPTIIPPSRQDLKRYLIPMLGLYPARGCPFQCNFCSVIKIAGRQVRSQRIETTLASLRAAKAAGVRMIMFTSDNFNKYDEAEGLLHAMIDERLGLNFFVQCDTQIARQESLVALLAKAGCFQMFIGVESFNRKTLLHAKKGQNRPETYTEIVRLCREYDITSHFSNIIGFPEDTKDEINNHLNTLLHLSPAWASFYILTPIPGTEQYNDFMAQGLITEKNLDRFDASHPTWRHPSLSRKQLLQMLFRCYRKFFSYSRAVARLWHLRFRERQGWKDLVESLSMSLFNQFCAWRQMHPMSGGIGRVRCDSVRDHLEQRRSRFGFDLAPLPASLSLPAAEERMNRYVNLRVPAISAVA